ncbi:MAG TPA: urea transporter [Methyloceanibacter sp.]|nr:urea transporter [Methyloceanibacter sp.]
MKAPVDYIFPPAVPGQVPYWRLVLRGTSQICFQSNELTGLFFLVAVLVASPISAAYLLVAGIMAPAGRMLMGERGPILATGLPGLNPCLIALALPAFFETGWANLGMWAVLVVCVAITIVLVRICVAILPFPTLALPFLIVFWALYALAPHLDAVQPLSFAATAQATFHPVTAVLLSLGQALFSPMVLSGVLFAAGVFLSNSRHGVLAIFGAIIGTAVAYYYSNVDPASADLGLYGFNGVLTAVSVFVVCGGKLRLSILGALLATIMTPAIVDLGVQSLSAPFVFTTWLMLGLGWIEDNWFDVEPAEASTPIPATKPARAARPRAASRVAHSRPGD